MLGFRPISTAPLSLPTDVLMCLHASLDVTIRLAAALALSERLGVVVGVDLRLAAAVDVSERLGCVVSVDTHLSGSVVRC